MKAGTRLLVGALVRLVLLGYGVWFAVRSDALGPDVPMASRIGLVILFVVMSILVGEMSQMRTHFSLLVGALRAAGGTAGAAAAPVAAAGAMAGDLTSDPRQPIEILLQALRMTSGDTQAKAHAHLKRLTGQNLPMDAAAWDAWWAENRDRYSGS